MIKSVFTGQAMVFAKEYEGRTYYSTSIGQKNQDGNYENAYIDLKFKKGVEVPNKAKIEIKNGWLKFRMKDKKPVWEIFVSEFETEDSIPEGFMAVDDSDCPF